MRAVGQADRGRGARDFLHRDDVGEVAQARAAVGFGNRHAEQAQLAELLPHVGGEFVLRVDLGRARRQLRIAHALHGIAQGVEFLGEVGIE